MTVTYSTLKVQKMVWDPVHAREETKTVKFESHKKNGEHIRIITRDQGVVTVECAKSGRAVEIPWAACLSGTVVKTLQRTITAEGMTTTLPTDFPPAGEEVPPSALTPKKRARK